MANIVLIIRVKNQFEKDVLLCEKKIPSCDLVPTIGAEIEDGAYTISKKIQSISLQPVNNEYHVFLEFATIQNSGLEQTKFNWEKHEWIVTKL